jgi:hypothetical protein
MEVRTLQTYRLNENEIKEAIRKHLIDILGTRPDIQEKNIELYASLGADQSPCDFVAVLTVVADVSQL